MKKMPKYWGVPRRELVQRHVVPACLESQQGRPLRPQRHPQLSSGEEEDRMKKMPKYWVFRGGGWSGAASCLRASYRGRFVPSARYDYLGIRLVRREG